jgi:hypothetical protein
MVKCERHGCYNRGTAGKKAAGKKIYKAWQTVWHNKMHSKAKGSTKTNIKKKW